MQVKIICIVPVSLRHIMSALLITDQLIRIIFVMIYKVIIFSRLVAGHSGYRSVFAANATPIMEVVLMNSESSEFSLQVDGVNAFVLQVRLGRRNIWKG